MFFDKPDISAVLLDVFELKQENVNMANTGRNFSALSFRDYADTEFYTADKVYKIGNNTVTFVPAGLDYTRKSKHDRIIVIHFNIQNYFFDDIELLKTKNPEKLSELFTEILKFWTDKESGYLYKCNSVFNEILAECFKENYIPKESKSKIVHSVKFMEENFTDTNITMKEIADKSYISEVYFRKLFKAEFGVSPVKYLAKLRLEKAINLMSTGYYSLKEVAINSGYTDYSYFSIDFKKHKGISPSLYFYNYSGTDTQKN